jgi:hypothetical protein
MLIRISLNWPLDAQASNTFFGRKEFGHDMHQMLGLCCNDDTWTLNPQSSSQWDGFRHFGYCKEEKYYGGVTTEELYKVDENGKKSTILGVQGELLLGVKICVANIWLGSLGEEGHCWARRAHRLPLLETGAGLGI